MADPVKANSEKPDTGGVPLDARSSSSQVEFEHEDNAPRRHNIRGDGMDETARNRLEASRKLAHPLAGLSRERLSSMGEEYARMAGLDSADDIRAFRLGAIVAGDENKYDTIDGLTEREREVLAMETTHKWKNPKTLYWVVAG